MEISEITKRYIVDELRLHHMPWYGKLGEIEFLNRIVDTSILPSTDSRFSNMSGDIWQHRINNNDWDEWWILDDPRLNLFNNNHVFIKFIEELTHPILLRDSNAQDALINIINSNLVNDGLKLEETARISNKPIYKVKEINKVAVKTNIDEKVTHEFILEQLKKSEEKIIKEDYDGAISNSRSLLETTIEYLYENISGAKLKKSGNLLDKYKVLKGQLNLSESAETNQYLVGILRGIVTIIGSFDQATNDMGDRHTRPVKPAAHHAHLCVNLSKTFVEFLFQSAKYQKKLHKNI